MLLKSFSISVWILFPGSAFTFTDSSKVSVSLLFRLCSERMNRLKWASHPGWLQGFVQTMLQDFSAVHPDDCAYYLHISTSVLTRSLWLLDEVMFGCSKAVRGWLLHSVSPAQTWCVQGQFWSPTRWRVSEINGEDCRRPCARRDLWMCNGAAALQMNPEASRGNSLIL